MRLKRTGAVQRGRVKQVKTPNEMLSDTLEFLSGQLTQGWLFFQCTRSLHKAYQANRLTSARYFFAAAYYAFLHESVLVLSKLIIQHKDSICMFYLLNQAENNTRLFKFATPDCVKQSVKEHRALLDNYAPLVESVRTQRDRVIAHLDRKNINDPSAIFSAPVNMTEVGDCFQAILGILNVYKGYYNNSELYLTEIEGAIQEDVDFLTGLIEVANRRSIPAA